MKLPAEFTNIPLNLLWDQLKRAKELQVLADTADERGYWSGFYDALVILLGNLTQKDTIGMYPTNLAKYRDFEMEDRLLLAEQELREENGGL